jgi:hypothetical protein
MIYRTHISSKLDVLLYNKRKHIYFNNKLFPRDCYISPYNNRKQLMQLFNNILIFIDMVYLHIF